MFIVAAAAMVVDIVPRNRVAEGMAYHGAAVVIGSLIGTGIAGFVKELIGYRWTFCFGSFLNVICLLFLLALKEKSDHSHTENPSYLTVVKDLNVLGSSITLLAVLIPYGIAMTFVPVFFDRLGIRRNRQRSSTCSHHFLHLTSPLKN